MASGDIVGQILRVIPPATSYATPDVRVGGSSPAENVPVWDFDDTNTEYLDFIVFLGLNYAGGGLTIVLPWSATSATVSSSQVLWEIAIRRIADDAEDVDTSQTYDYNQRATTCASAAGEIKYTAMTFTNGADMDSWAAGECAIVRVRRDPSSEVPSSMVGDAELWTLIVKET